MHIHTCFRFSVGELLLVVAKYEFSPALSDKNMLELKPGEKLVVLDKVSLADDLSNELK